jgi:4-amino-4-deoxy-L-arabinose transferase-like glycosyltransferase
VLKIARKLNDRTLTWVILGAWVLGCLATLDYNGPFMDEGIYVTAGQRTLEGHGLTDGFLGWFAGSLVWPVLAGLGSRIGGLLGARAVAVLLSGAAFASLTLAARNLFGDRVAFWTALAFAASGPVLATARMAVYDSSALAGIALSWYAITELAKRDHRGWLVLAAAAYCWAIFSKYPTGLMLVPLVGAVLVLRGRKAMTDLFLFGFLSGAITLAFFLPVRERVASFFSYRLVNSPAVGVTRAMVAVDLLRLSAAPLALAVVGWWAARERRWLATVLLLALIMWPAYHLILGDSVSRSKHLVLGFTFGYPLVGLALDWIWTHGGERLGGIAGRAAVEWLGRGAAIAASLGLIALGVVQVERFNRAWPDARSAAAYLLEQVQPGEKLLINESWPYTAYLYGAGRLETPWDVFDVYRITHGQSEVDLCEYDWFVDSQGSYQWPGWIVFDVHRCGVYEPVWKGESTVVGMGRDLDYVRYQVKVVVWRNMESMGAEQ